MTSADDRTRASRSTRLLSSLRDVLFENTEPALTKSIVTVAVSAPLPIADTETEAARAVLRAAIEGQLGPGIREYSLQNQALADALPDAVVRRRAALRVLALKGTTREHLRLELEHALSILAAQGDAFAKKLRDRRELVAANQEESSGRCSQETAEAERAIALLTAQIESQQRAIIDAEARRDQERAAAEATQSELLAREGGFQRAFHDVEHEYASLKQELSEEPQ